MCISKSTVPDKVAEVWYKVKILLYRNQNTEEIVIGHQTKYIIERTKNENNNFKIKAYLASNM